MASLESNHGTQFSFRYPFLPRRQLARRSAWPLTRQHQSLQINAILPSCSQTMPAQCWQTVFDIFFFAVHTRLVLTNRLMSMPVSAKSVCCFPCVRHGLNMWKTAQIKQCEKQSAIWRRGNKDLLRMRESNNQPTKQTNKTNQSVEELNLSINTRPLQSERA